MSKPPRTIQSLDRAVALLRELAAAPEGLHLGRLAERVGLAVQTVQGLLRTLQVHGLVTQAGRGDPYLLGGEIHRLSRAWTSLRAPSPRARRLLADLCAELSEYVILCELRGPCWTPLLEYHANHTLVVQGESGQTSVLHTMATGKLLLALTDAPRREHIIAQLDFSPHGPGSINSEAALRRELDEIARRREAVCVEERCPGIAAAAVAVSGAGGEPAALGVSIPMARFSPTRLDEAMAAMRRCVAALEPKT